MDILRARFKYRGPAILISGRRPRYPFDDYWQQLRVFKLLQALEFNRRLKSVPKSIEMRAVPRRWWSTRLWEGRPLYSGDTQYLRYGQFKTPPEGVKLVNSDLTIAPGTLSPSQGPSSEEVSA